MDSTRTLLRQPAAVAVAVALEALDQGERHLLERALIEALLVLRRIPRAGSALRTLIQLFADARRGRTPLALPVAAAVVGVAAEPWVAIMSAAARAGRLGRRPLSARAPKAALDLALGARRTRSTPPE